MEQEQAAPLPAPQQDEGQQPLSINLRTYSEEEGRFYCPFPGCTRSFAELWRLKVHYRAPPDIRGSGKERGHGTELMHCPKCGNTLKPGKHHVGCIAGKGAPRLVSKRKGSGTAENGEGMAPPKKSKKKAQPKPEPQHLEQEQESSTNIPMPLLPTLPDMSIPSMTPSNGWGGLDMHAPQDSSMLPLGLSIPPPQFWPEFPASSTQQQPASYSNGGAQLPLPGYPWQSAPQLPGSLMMPFMLPPPPMPSQGEQSAPGAVDPAWAAWTQQQQQHQQFQQFMQQPTNHDSYAQPQQQQQQQSAFSMHYPPQQQQQQQQQHPQEHHNQPSHANTAGFMSPSDTSQAAAAMMPPRLPTPADKPNPDLGPGSRQMAPMGANNPGGCTLQSMSSLPSLGSLASDILPDPLSTMSDPVHNLQSMPHHHPQPNGGTGNTQQPSTLTHTPSSAESAPSPPGGAARGSGMLSSAGVAMGSQAAAASAEETPAPPLIQDVDGDLMRVPSPPPLPNDFHPGNARPIFNFGQFNQRMPASQSNFGSISNQELGDIEAMDLAELNVVYDHSDDGELMQLLFGIGGDVPSMATVHMHKGPSPPPLPQIPDEDEPSLLLNRPSPIQGMNGSHLINPRPRSTTPQLTQQHQQHQHQYQQQPPQQQLAQAPQRVTAPLPMPPNPPSYPQRQSSLESKPLANPPQFGSHSFSHQNGLPHIRQLPQPPKTQQQPNLPSQPLQIKQEAPQTRQGQQHTAFSMHYPPSQQQQQEQQQQGRIPQQSQPQPPPSQHQPLQQPLQQPHMSSGPAPMVCGQAELARQHHHHHLLGSSRPSSALNLAAFADRDSAPSDSLAPLMPPPSCGCGGGCELGA